MEINRFIDHTLLKPDAVLAQYERLCSESLEHNFFSVCVPPHMVDYATKRLHASNTKVCTVIGFPLGYNLTVTKAAETEKLVELGAAEIDMVFNISAFKDQNYEYVKTDIEAVVSKAQKNLVKVIIETALLTDEEIFKASQLVCETGAHFVKTSTGFSTGGARLEHIKIMKSAVGDKIKIKASGGVKNLSDARAMIGAGANRLGTSSGVQIMSELPNV